MQYSIPTHVFAVLSTMINFKNYIDPVENSIRIEKNPDRENHIYVYTATNHQIMAYEIECPEFDFEGIISISPTQQFLDIISKYSTIIANLDTDLENGITNIEIQYNALYPAMIIKNLKTENVAGYYTLIHKIINSIVESKTKTSDIYINYNNFYKMFKIIKKLHKDYCCHLSFTGEGNAVIVTFDNPEEKYPIYNKDNLLGNLIMIFTTYSYK